MADRDKERTERAGDPQVSAAYRELGAEEPPRAFDDAILAAAPRAVRSHPAPLVAPTGQRSWFGPLAAAAVLVLAVAVTLHMQIEQPDLESPVPQSPRPAAVREAAKDVAQEAAKPAAAAKETIARRKSAEQAASPAAAAPAVPAAPGQKPFVADQSVASARAPQSGPVQALVKRADRAESAERVEAQANLQASTQADTPERELERIAGLRRQGLHAEADKALAEFRKRYPEFRISEEMRARVERR